MSSGAPDSAREPLEPLILSSRGPVSHGCCPCSWLLKLYAVLALLGILLAPVICLVAAIVPGSIGGQTLLAIAVGVPLLLFLTLVWPVCVYDPDAYDNVSLTQFTINGNTMNYENYSSKLVDFLNAASTSTETWLSDYAKWFEQFTTNDKMIGTMGCGTKMYYSHATCKEKLQQMTSRISAGSLKRESQLALGFFNNISWPEVGRFALGTSKEDHAFTRPFLAEMFASSNGWSPATLRSEFKSLFQSIITLDHNNRTGHRVKFEPFFPSRSKNIFTQWTLKVLHRVALGIDLSDREAEELAAMQTVGLLTGGATSALCRLFLFYAFFTKPTLVARAKYIEKYRPYIQKRWPNEEWTIRKLDLLGSVLLDAMLFAGGRSVPLAMDLVLGYVLTRNKPESVAGVDFKKEENIRSLLMECMRFHPVVTTLPYWIKSDVTGTGQGEWEHEAVCIDRALADPAVFPDPDTFHLNRPGQQSTDESSSSNSIAWAEFACVDGQINHPHSHCCPAKALSINMIVAFVQEYHAAGPWRVVDDNITFDYYGTSAGFKCVKMVP